LEHAELFQDRTREYEHVFIGGRHTMIVPFV
jgi:hypothetical protein